jgi:hypothetical protein
MSCTPYQGTLSDEERRLVDVMRELPEGRLRESFRGLLGALMAFVSDPHCAERQADGVPCGDAQAACDQCQNTASILARLRRELP